MSADKGAHLGILKIRYLDEQRKCADRSVLRSGGPTGSLSCSFILAAVIASDRDDLFGSYLPHIFLYLNLALPFFFVPCHISCTATIAQLRRLCRLSPVCAGGEWMH